MEEPLTADKLLQKVKSCFDSKFDTLGAVPEGVYWNSAKAQEARFDQLLKLCPAEGDFSILDYGCGYGALADYMTRRGYRFSYQGFDISSAMIEKAGELFAGKSGWRFSSTESDLQPADFVVESGIFNLKLDSGKEEWTTYVISVLERMNSLATKGLAFNMLTTYSDADRMQPDLYYADPCFFFDYCKRHFSRNVALLHDYELYDFTILVRK
jgi:SAM-dependent methyltransferase